MARKPPPQQPSNDDDSSPERPDVGSVMKPLTHSGDGETFEYKDPERQRDE